MTGGLRRASSGCGRHGSCGGSRAARRGGVGSAGWASGRQPVAVPLPAAGGGGGRGSPGSMNLDSRPKSYMCRR